MRKSVDLADIEHIVCTRCGGTGWLYDNFMFGKYVKEQRLLSGMTLKQLAMKMGKSTQYIFDLERGYHKWHEPSVKLALDALSIQEEHNGQ